MMAEDRPPLRGAKEATSSIIKILPHQIGLWNVCLCVCGRSRMAIKGLVSLGQCWCCQRVCHPARGSPKDRSQPQHPLKAAIGFKM